VLPLFRQIFVSARSIQVIAHFLASWAQKMGARTEATVIPNGVSCEAFSLSDQEHNSFRKTLRDELNIADKAFVILSVSRLVEKNGIADLLEAVRNLPDAHLLLIGDGKLRKSLEQQCINFRERVHFLGTHQQNELRQFAAAADVFCRPAHSEGQGIAFLEGLCMGLPVVATRVGGIPEIIEHNRHGLLVEPRNIDQLRKALAELRDDQAKRSQMIVAGESHVKGFSWKLLAPKIENWLSSNIK